MGTETIAERIRIATAGDTLREVGLKLQMSSETIRRYMNGQTPSIEFVTEICRVYGVSLAWLVYGKGPRTDAAIRDDILRNVSNQELLGLLASRLDQVQSRLDVLEGKAGIVGIKRAPRAASAMRD